MHRHTMQLTLRVAEHLHVHTLDLTGGSPEMNPDFRWLVAEARRRGLKVMDRLNTTISVDYDSNLHDCDFNQMLKMPLAGRTHPTHLRDLLDSALPHRIGVAAHCYGCTAGQGSSCGGALNVEEAA